MGMNNLENAFCDQKSGNASMKYNFSSYSSCILSFTLLSIHVIFNVGKKKIILLMEIFLKIIN